MKNSWLRVKANQKDFKVTWFEFEQNKQIESFSQGNSFSQEAIQFEALENTNFWKKFDFAVPFLN